MTFVPFGSLYSPGRKQGEKEIKQQQQQNKTKKQQGKKVISYKQPHRKTKHLSFTWETLPLKLLEWKWQISANWMLLTNIAILLQGTCKHGNWREQPQGFFHNTLKVSKFLQIIHCNRTLCVAYPKENRDERGTRWVHSALNKHAHPISLQQLRS